MVSLGRRALADEKPTTTRRENEHRRAARADARHFARGIQFTVENARGPQPRAGPVRMTTLTGRCDREPIRDGKATRAMYRVQIDFAGSVPRWMVRGGAAKELPGLYDGIRFEAAVRR